MLLLILGTATLEEALAYCPPCHHGSFRGVHPYSFAEEEADINARPWGVMVPPAPNAPLTACGCGVNKKTSRDDLRAMDKPELASKIRDLEKTDATLESEIEEAKEEHKAEIQELESDCDELKKKDKEQRATIEKAATKRLDMQKEIKGKSGDDLDEIENINEELGTLRDKDKKTREEVTMRLMDMEMCGCKPEDALLLQDAQLLKESRIIGNLGLLASTSSMGKKQPAANKPDMEKVMKFEDLEDKKGQLMDEQSDELMEFGNKQRELTGEIEIMKNKIERQEIQAEKIEHTDKRSEKVMKFQGKAMGGWLEKKQAQLKRLKEDVAKGEETYKKLEKAMGKCGCGPQGR